MPAGSELAQAERETLANPIVKLEFAAAKSDGELGVVFRAVDSLKERVATGSNRASTAKVQACETLDKMSELRSLIDGLTQTVGGEHVQVAGLVEMELFRVCLIVTAPLIESEGTVINTIYGMLDNFPVEASQSMPGPSTGNSSVPP